MIFWQKIAILAIITFKKSKQFDKMTTSNGIHEKIRTKSQKFGTNLDFNDY